MMLRKSMIVCAVAALLAACGGGGGEPSSASTPALAVNKAPVADAGPAQSVLTGATITLTGGASTDPDADALTYRWSLDSKPVGSSAQLSDLAAVKPTFTADRAGNHVATLAVNDGKLSSAAMTVTVSAAAVNVAPVANAGMAQNVTRGTLVTLDGSASSDANGDVLTYSWTLTSKPASQQAATHRFHRARSQRLRSQPMLLGSTWLP